MTRGHDAALVDRLRGGERDAFRELYGRFAQPTFAFLLRLARRRDVAEDLHQETWLSIARHAARLTPDTDLAAWIFTIARNRFLSSRRHLELTAPSADAAALDGIAGEAPFTDPARFDLERALASLPEIHREVLLLVGVQGLDAGQAARVLSIREDAARQRVARARAALAQALNDADAAEDRRPDRKASS
jgi:RNA polymerase sigma-70 factor, ECF subfamily